MRTLWILSQKSSQQLKLDSLLKIIDQDNDGKINESDLYYILNILGLGTQQFQSQQLQKIVRKLIKENSINNHNYLTFYELTKLFGEQQLLEKMTIILRFLKILLIYFADICKNDYDKLCKMQILPHSLAVTD